MHWLLPLGCAGMAWHGMARTALLLRHCWHSRQVQPTSICRPPLLCVPGHLLHRGRVVGAGCLLWAGCTAAFAACGSLAAGAAVWAVNGLGLALVLPNTQARHDSRAGVVRLRIVHAAACPPLGMLPLCPPPVPASH